MTGDATPEMLGFEPDDPKRRRRANGWEIALWVLGIVLLLGAVAVGYYFLQYIYAASTSPSPDIGFLSAFFQASSIVMPGLVTGGIVCIALAIFARALDVNARRRLAAVGAPAIVPSATATPPTASSPASGGPTGPVPADPAPGAPTSASARQAPPPTPAATTDYSPYMRPPADPPDSQA